jgi:hypothetical protein
MQFGHVLHRILRKIRFANPSHGPVYLLKVDIADRFYQVYVAPPFFPASCPLDGPFSCTAGAQ